MHGTAALTYNSVYKMICHKVKIKNKMSVHGLLKPSNYTIGNTCYVTILQHSSYREFE
jgi:hypothetical protein